MGKKGIVMKKQDGIKSVSINVANKADQMNLSQMGQSFTVSGRGHGRRCRFSEGSTNRAARRAAAANKRKGVK